MRRRRYFFACVVSSILSALLIVLGFSVGTSAGVGGCHRSCIFGIAPCFFGGTFHLIRYAGVGEFLIAYCFAYALLDFACYLVELTFYFFCVHGLLLI